MRRKRRGKSPNTARQWPQVKAVYPSGTGRVRRNAPTAPAPRARRAERVEAEPRVANLAWLSVDSRALHHAVVMVSELYDDLLADEVAHEQEHARVGGAPRRDVAHPPGDPGTAVGARTPALRPAAGEGRRSAFGHAPRITTPCASPTLASVIEAVTAGVAANLLSTGIIGLANGAAGWLRARSVSTLPSWSRGLDFDPARFARRLNMSVAAEGVLGPDDHRALRSMLGGAEIAATGRLIAAVALIDSLEWRRKHAAREASGSAEVDETDSTSSGQQFRRYGEQLVHRVLALVDFSMELPRHRSEALAHLLVQVTYEELRACLQPMTARRAEHMQGSVRQALFELNRGLDLGPSRFRADVAELRRYVERLRPALNSRYSTIVPPSFSGTLRMPVDQLYVPPELEPATPSAGVRLLDGPGPRGRSEVSDAAAVVVSAHTGGRSEVAEAAAVIASAHRLVLLGDPGAGKSTLAQWIAYTASRPPGPDDAWIKRSRLALPVALRAYQSAGARGFVDYIERFVTERLAVVPLEGGVVALLEEGLLTVVFDGLDEVAGESARQELVKDIESFAVRFGSAPVIVTSRAVGYTRAPLDPTAFTAWRIRGFDDGRVAAFVHRWYSLAENELQREGDSGAAEVHARAFMRESAELTDLRGNPLLLSLLCGLHRGDGYLPVSRPQVFERCAQMLYERWDRSRNLSTPVFYEGHLRELLMDIALWVYRQPKLHDGITRETLEARVSKHLNGRRYRDPIRAADAAREVVDYVTGRAWVFADVSLDPDYETFAFVHRSLMEYFAAAELVRRAPTAASLWRELRPHVLVEDWWTVGGLAVQVLSGAQSRGLVRITRALVRDIEGATDLSPEKRAAVVWFLCEVMAFIVLPPRAVEQAAIAIVSAIGQGFVGAFLRSVANFNEANLESLGDVTMEAAERILSDDHQSLTGISYLICAGACASRVSDAGVRQRLEGRAARFFSTRTTFETWLAGMGMSGVFGPDTTQRLVELTRGVVRKPAADV